MAIWRQKIARYLAYCIDGGLLQKKFTLQTIIELMDKLEQDAKADIDAEIAYLLHCYKRESPGDIIEDLASAQIDPQNACFNQNVMVALVQYEYLRKLMNTQRMYPKFLTAMLRDDYMEE